MMGKIQVLDSLLADMIAAGEVVERPASVVKELCENAIDAGAGKIIVELTHGGISFLRVTDDGCGIAGEEAALAFCRHATSKISTPADLHNILTMGFRGEALASIAAVSRMEMITKTKEQPFGTHVQVEAGEIKNQSEIGCPDGTTVLVRDLFFNVPARMKFLKKDATEGSAVGDVVERLALGNPHISFQLLADGKEKLRTPGDGSLKSAIYAIYGRDYAQELEEVSYEQNGIQVTGFCGKPSIARSTRGYQSFFVNGRFVKSRTMVFALEEAYRDSVMKGKYPFGVFYIQVNPQLVDVNVHPAKMEVKFSDEKAVNSALYWGVKNALQKTTYVPEIQAKPVQVVTPPPAPITKPSKPVQYLRQEAPTFHAIEQIPLPLETKPKFAETKVAPEPVSVPAEPLVEETVVSQPLRVIGQIFDSFLLAERGEELVIIDQHAVHERLLFEELLQQRKEDGLPTQSLLTPLVLTMTKQECRQVVEHLDLFTELGFEIEEFGDDSLLLRGAPRVHEKQNVEELFWETVRCLRTMDVATARTEQESELLYSMACHGAIKANHRLQMAEMQQLAEDAATLPPTCPHGRPTMISFTRKMLEKEFKRIR